MELKTSSLERPKLHHPGNMAIYGPSKSGKTQFISRILEHRKDLFEFSDFSNGKEFKKIIYFYGVWQDFYSQLKAKHGSKIIFVEGFPEDGLQGTLSTEETPALIILDDLEKEVYNSEKARHADPRFSPHGSVRHNGLSRSFRKGV